MSNDNKIILNDVQFIGCPHFGHPAQALRRGFKSVTEMDTEIIKRFNANASNKTLSIIVGDVVVFNKNYAILDQLLGKKIFVLGNHDDRNAVKNLINFGEVQGAFEYKGLIVTHIPIHRDSMDRYLLNVHSHLHDEHVKRTIYKPLDILAKRLKDNRYLNVNWDILGGKPMSLAEVLNCAAENKPSARR